MSKYIADIALAGTLRERALAIERAQAQGEDPKKIDRAVADSPSDKFTTAGQLLTAFGQGASFGMIPHVQEMLGFDDAAQRHRDYMQQARADQPQAVSAAQLVGGAAGATAAALAPAAVGARAAAGQSVLAGPGSFPGTMRWGVLAPGLGLLDVPPEEVAEQQQQSPRPSIAQIQQQGTMPSDAGPRMAPPQERPPVNGLPGMPPALGQYAMEYIQRPEVIAELEERARLEQLAEARYGEMLTPGRNVVGSTAPGTGVGRGGAVVLGELSRMTQEQLPIIGDAIALAEVGIDMFHGIWDVGTTLALASVIPGVPSGGRAFRRYVKRADKTGIMDNLDPKILGNIEETNRKRMARRLRGEDLGTQYNRQIDKLLELEKAGDLDRALTKAQIDRAFVQSKERLLRQLTPDQRKALEEFAKKHTPDEVGAKFDEMAEESMGELRKLSREYGEMSDLERLDAFRQSYKQADVEIEPTQFSERLKRENDYNRLSRTGQLTRGEAADWMRGGRKPSPTPEKGKMPGFDPAKDKQLYLPDTDPIKTAPRDDMIGAQFEDPKHYADRLADLKAKNAAGGRQHDDLADFTEREMRARRKLGAGRDDSGKYAASTRAPGPEGRSPSDVTDTMNPKELRAARKADAEAARKAAKLRSDLRNMSDAEVSRLAKNGTLRERELAGRELARRRY
jgi:hypothetical protein